MRPLRYVGAFFYIWRCAAIPTTKHIILLADGMADEPMECLQGRTPLEYAYTPCMDGLAPRSEIGNVRTVPEGMNPGSDVANMGLMGYDPAQWYSGRASLEASRLGLEWADDSIAIRLNFVTIEGNGSFEDKRILYYGAGGIGDDDARLLMCDLKQHFNIPYTFHYGGGFHHILMGNGCPPSTATPPHDIIGQPIGKHLGGNLELSDIMRRSHTFLSQHPVNLALAANGKPMANSIWLWGSGARTSLPNFQKSNGLMGAVVTATDVVGGIASCAGMELVQLGALGTAASYRAAADAALKLLLRQDYDFIYVHIDTPDNASHDGNMAAKITAIEDIDRNVLRIICAGLDVHCVPYRLLLLPDHATPVRLRTHTGQPVPYMLYNSDSPQLQQPEAVYTEPYAAGCTHNFDAGWKLFRHLISAH